MLYMHVCVYILYIIICMYTVCMYLSVIYKYAFKNLSSCTTGKNLLVLH